MNNHCFGCDFGSYHLKIYHKEQDSCLMQHNMVAVQDKKEMLAYGDEADANIVCINNRSHRIADNVHQQGFHHFCDSLRCRQIRCCICQSQGYRKCKGCNHRNQRCQECAEHIQNNNGFNDTSVTFSGMA